MKITNVQMTFWIGQKGDSKKINCCEDAEQIVAKIKMLLENEGYYIPKEFCGQNPSLYIEMK